MLALGLASSHYAPAAHAEQNGQAIFRFDTFGDEQLWTDVLRMHEVISTTVDPATALAVGLKVDIDALPRQSLLRCAPARSTSLIPPSRSPCCSSTRSSA